MPTRYIQAPKARYVSKAHRQEREEDATAMAADQKSSKRAERAVRRDTRGLAAGRVEGKRKA